MRNMKKSFLMSVVALLLCFVMFLGTTFAWFTDSVTSSGNKIIAGTLKLDLEMLDKTTGAWYSVKENKDPIFNYEYWEPGYTNVAFLKVENEGNLALKWQARFISDAAVSKLAEVIDVYVMPSETELSYDNLTRDFDGWQRVGTLDQFINTLSDTTYGYLTHEGDVAYLGIALHMQEDAGNEYQGIGLEAFDIQIVATQMSYENDSFGPDYDNDAQWPEGEMNFSATQSLANVSIINGELAEDVIIRHESGVYAVVPAGVKLADGVTELKFSGKNVDNAGNFADDAKSYDIHIEGIADDNTTCITVYIGEILEAGLDETELKLYHEDAQMRRVDSVADFQINNQFTYDSATGAVVLYVDNFSVFSGVKTTADVWDGDENGADVSWYDENKTEFVLTKADQLVGFRKLVDGGNTFSGKTVKLGADIDLAGINFDPIGFGYYDDDNSDGKTNYRVFMGTFDGAGHTIYNLYQNCWELDPDKENYSTYTYSTAGAGLFASIKNATIKNLAVSGAEIVFECVDMGVVVGYAQGSCHFENIVVTDSKIANYNRYTGGVVGEVSYGPYGVDTSLGYSHTFKNVTVDSTVTVSGLWGSFGCGMGGVIGGKWGDATVKMENVVSAPVMDVYNDVVSAYQWYAFRGCGMLIGHTEEPYSDGRHSGNATASFLTCENVKVYYGYWVNYHYYEFEYQDSTTGQRYPWVRAEAGEYCDAFSNIRYGVPTHGGVKVSDLTEEELKEKATDYTPIVFDQLYGADRGMYGTATHEGVNVYYKNTKTIYIENNLSWTNLKLNYWFAHGNETWTTLTDAIALTEENGVYKVDLPAYVHTFKISSSESAEGKDFELSGLTDGEHITLDGEHVHMFVNRECVCGAVRFEFGENTSSGHKESTKAAENYTETVANYTLSIMDASQMFTSSHDKQGNSCIKLGTGEKTAKISFTVPNSVVQVIVYVAKYKDNASTVVINGTEHSLTNNSDDGKYDEIVVVTTETKTITVATTSSAKRCMVNSIVFIVEKLDHEHNYTSVVTDPTCTEDGYTTYTCSICKHSYVEAGEEKKGHSYNEVVTTEPTCTEKGEKTLTCSACGDSKTEEIDTIEHNYVGGVCSMCSDKLSQNPVCQIVTDASELKAGDKIVIVAKDSNYALSTTQNGNNRGQATVTKTNDQITFGDDVQVLTLEVGTVDGTFAFNTGSGYLYAASSGSNYLKTQTTNNANGSWKIEIASDGKATIKAQGTNTRNWLRYNSTNNPPIFSCYGSGQSDVVIYKLSNSEGGETPSCEHTNTTTITVDATCTVAGSITVTCDDCGVTVDTKTIPTTAHTDANDDDDHNCDVCGAENVTEHYYIDGVCNCGAEEPNAGGTTDPVTATLTFDNTSKRTEYTTSIQVWKENGITLTNNKTNSSSNVADYANPARFYKDSEIVVSAPGKITKIVFDCSSSSYATALKNSIGTVNGGNVSVSGSSVTVTLDGTSESFTLTLSSGQVRMTSITVTYTPEN